MKIWHKLSVIERNFQSSDRTQTDTDQKHPPDLRLLLSSIMEESYTRRIVILGKTGSGKSSLANTILGTKDFNVNDSPNSGTKKCQSETKCVNGRSVQLVDTPGLFDTDPESPELSPEIIRCITECAPGPHAFLLVLKVEKFTKQEQAVVDIILENFSEEALKYTTVVFTHGDALPEGMKIKDWVSKNDALKHLVKKCGGRCHVFDSKYWNKPEEKYRNNKVQVEELLKTIDTTVRENRGEYYTNELLTEVSEAIKRKMEDIKASSSGKTSLEDILQKAKEFIYSKLMNNMKGAAIGVVLGGLLGLGVMAILAVVSPCLLSCVALPVQGALVGGLIGGIVGVTVSEAVQKESSLHNKAENCYKKLN